LHAFLSECRQQEATPKENEGRHSPRKGHVVREEDHCHFNFQDLPETYLCGFIIENVFSTQVAATTSAQSSLQWTTIATNSERRLAFPMFNASRLTQQHHRARQRN
jgi:hypothetical protein